MWPTDPDGFESQVVAPESADHSDGWFFLVMEGRIACVSEGGIPRPIDAGDMRWLDVEITFEHYMGQYQGRSCFAVQASGKLPQGYSLAGLREWLGRAQPHLFYLAGRASQIVEWHRTHQHCGVCGSPMVDHHSDRAKYCKQCRNLSYPRLSPSIIVLVRDGDKMLLARNAAWPNGMYSTLAGFVEPGESIEQTVHREVFEEVGIQITNLRYLGSQSWPFPNSLMLGFHADYAGGDLVFNDGEIADAAWYRFDELPNVPPRHAISRWLIDDFIGQMNA